MDNLPKPLPQFMKQEMEKLLNGSNDSAVEKGNFNNNTNANNSVGKWPRFPHLYCSNVPHKD